MENLLKEQSNNIFCKSYIEKDSIVLYNIYTSEIVENKYIQVFGEIDTLYINIILRKLFAYFQKQGYQINTPEDFLQLCNK